MGNPLDVEGITLSLPGGALSAQVAVKGLFQKSRASLPFGRGSRVTRQGSMVNGRGSRVNGRWWKNILRVKLFFLPDCKFKLYQKITRTLKMRLRIVVSTQVLFKILFIQGGDPVASFCLTIHSLMKR